MTGRFLRVEQALTLTTGLFEATNDEIWQAIKRAISAEIPEADDLDFKSEWWSDNKELAKDCAAFANATGGVLIYGVDDGGRDVAANLSPVSELDKFEERVQSVTASSIALAPVPTLPWSAELGFPAGTGPHGRAFQGSGSRSYSDEPDARITNNLMASRVARMAVPKAWPRSSRLGVKVPSPVPSA